MALMKSGVMFKVCGAKTVGEQKVKVKPIEHRYEKDGEPEYIKYGCPLCEDLGRDTERFIQVNYSMKKASSKLFLFQKGNQIALFVE